MSGAWQQYPGGVPPRPHPGRQPAPPPPYFGPAPLPPRPGPGALLGGAFRVLGRTWHTLLGALLVGELVMLATSVGVGFGMYALRGGSDLGTGSTDPSLLVDFALIYALPVILLLYLIQGVTGALAGTLAAQYATGTRVTVRGLLRASAPRVPGTVGGYLLTGVVLIPLLVTPLAPLAVWLWAVLALVPSVMAHENVGVFSALGRTVDLLKGSWWWVFSNMVIATVVAFGVDVLGGFFLSVPESAIQAADDVDSPSPEDVASFLGAAAGAFTLLVGILMFQLAFTHLVGAQLYTALRDRYSAMPSPIAPPYPPPAPPGAYPPPAPPGAFPPPRRPGR
ncbi:hypothetical protein ACWGQ4_17290 [Streptomyces sp. NPDC055721]|uniref:hypothetical protein n=1 Tax=Streptomyces sp. NPDC127132 TaxID=3345374 RepID=UPI00363F675F